MPAALDRGEFRLDYQPLVSLRHGTLEGMEALARRPAAGPPPYVSVNLAVSQLRQPGLVGEVIAVLDRTGLAPRRLQLEITETAVIDPGDQAEGTTIGNLRALAALGVRIAVDDFGTGYSNLSYLPVLPLHGLKLAGSFLSLGTAAPGGHDFLASLVTLSHAIGLAEQVDALVSGRPCVRSSTR